METLKKYWAMIGAGVAGFVGILLFLLSRKGAEVNALQAKVALAKTEKEADVLEAQIQALKTNKDNLAKHNAELDKTLEAVENKRVEIREEAKNLKDPKEIASYWNNQ
jgi:predicted  nucleic acid-binding Zn-ribbon protein